MKIIHEKDIISVFIQNKSKKDIEDINSYMKELVLILKRKYRKDITGFYKVNVYYNEKIGLIIDFIRREEVDFLDDFTSLKISFCEEDDIYLEFEDYFLFDDIKTYYFNNRYYINIEDISLELFIKKLEFFNVVYGESLKRLKKTWVLV